MVRAARVERDWIEEYRKRPEPSDKDLKRMEEVLKKADELRTRLKIAPLTTGELVRSIRDEADSAN